MNSPDKTVIAAIDVGTNSVHMVVAQVTAGGFDVLTTEKEVVRLGVGGEDRLSGAAIERGVDALKRMRRIADAHGAKIRAVATSAVREADNAREFLHRVREEAGVDVEVITGAEEARLIWLGVGQALVLGATPTLVIDIGGGSTEFAVSANGKLKLAQSLKLGAVRLTDAFSLGDKPDEDDLRDMRAHIRSKLAGLVHDIGVIGFERVVLSSGTCETIARMGALRRRQALPGVMNGYEFTAADVSAIRKEIVACTDGRERAALQGMDAKRADIIVAGAVLLDEILRALDIDTVEYCNFALREGLLADTISRELGDDHHRFDAGMQSVVRLADRCSVDLQHNGHIAFLATRIFRGLQDFYDLDSDFERLLNAAAYLSNAGNAISYSKHHQHSYYIIRNADLLGFTDREIELIALAARYHRKSLPKETHPEFMRLESDDRFGVEVLAGILRIATGLDRSHDQCTSDVRVELNRQKSGDELVITALQSCGPESAELNIYTATKGRELLERVLGDKITISATPHKSKRR